MYKYFLILFLIPGILFSQEEYTAKIVCNDGSIGSCVSVYKFSDSEQDGYLGVLATANHVIHREGSNIKYKVEFPNGKTCSTSYIIQQDDECDVALLLSWIPNSTEVCKIKSEEPDGKVIICGYRYGGPLEKNYGRFLRKIDRYYYTDTFPRPGESGGGVWNNNELIGIVSGGWFWIKDEEYEGKNKTWPLRSCSSDVIIEMLENIKGKKLYE